MTLTDESPMPWGKEHFGTKMANVPADYLDWAYGFIMDRNLNSTAARDVKIYIDGRRDIIDAELRETESEDFNGREY